MAKKLRIAVDARPLSVPAAGIGRYCRELLVRLIDSPHEWFLYSDGPLLEGFPDVPNVHIRHGNVRFSMVGTFFAQVVFPLWAKKDSIDLFWSPRHHLPAALSARVSKVVTIHDLVWVKYPQTMTRLGALLERLLMPQAIRTSKQIICVSASTSRDVASYFGITDDILHTIHSGGFDESREISDSFSIACEMDQPYILFVGTLEPRKNLKRCLQAYAGLVDKGELPHHFYLIGGDGWGDDNLEPIISHYGLEQRVTVLGRVSDNELLRWYTNADVFLMPSLYEGFGLPLIEAMSFGVPVVTSNTSSMPEVAGDGGLLVDPLSVESIQGALNLLCLNRQLHKEKSSQAKRQAEKFTWENSARETLRVLELAANFKSRNEDL